MGVRTLLLAGDAAAVAQEIARELGVREVKVDLLPEDKLRWVEALRRTGGTVAMVDDGVNDAPALVAANLGTRYP